MQSLIPIAKAEFTKSSLLIGDDLSESEWLRLGVELMKWSESVAWWLGDWLNFGMQRWGEKYTAAIEATGYNYQSLRDFAWVAGSVSVSFRKDNLKWSHHREVAGMEATEQQEWLTKAEREGWSVGQLRTAIRQANAKPSGTIDRSVEFCPMRWSMDFCRWYKRSDPTNWGPVQRSAVKRELEPLVRIYEEL